MEWDPFETGILASHDRPANAIHVLRLLSHLTCYSRRVHSIYSTCHVFMGMTNPTATSCASSYRLDFVLCLLLQGLSATSRAVAPTENVCTELSPWSGFAPLGLGLWNPTIQQRVARLARYLARLGLACLCVMQEVVPLLQEQTTGTSFASRNRGICTLSRKPRRPYSVQAGTLGWVNYGRTHAAPSFVQPLLAPPNDGTVYPV